ncbi:MAG TPA: discoidin domain-containing protein, partial [Thermomicrobiales bacterium]|nr:discoidin domain-containing protein [Thermomicrobiales bacterium]
DGADQWVLELSADGSSWTSIGTFGNAPVQNSWYGTTVGQNARYVRATFTNTRNRPVLGYMSEMQVWGGAALSGASAEKTVVTPTEIPTSAATATIAPTEMPSATATPSPTTEPTATPTIEPTVAPTLEPTTEPTATVMPTATVAIEAAGETATVVGTDGEGVFCRIAPSTDAEVITTLPEGSVVEVAGAAVDGWTPVTCGTDTVGYVSTDFLASGGAAPTATVTAVEMTTPAETIVGIEPVSTEGATSTATAENTGSADNGEATEVALEPTLEPTVEPTAEPSVTPLPIVATSDSEQTGTAYMAVDDDPATSWTVVPNLSPKRVELLLDLGQVQPVGRATVELSAWNTLPYTEIWLSEDGETWWNVTQLDGSSLEPDQTYEFPLGYWARYVLVVVPHADQSGLAEIGGIRQLSIWASDDGDALTLDMLGMPVTPEPLPTEPPPPTDVPVATEPPFEEPAETVVPEATVAPEATEPEGEDVPAEGDQGE